MTTLLTPEAYQRISREFFEAYEGFAKSPSSALCLIQCKLVAEQYTGVPKFVSVFPLTLVDYADWIKLSILIKAVMAYKGDHLLMLAESERRYLASSYMSIKLDAGSIDVFAKMGWQPFCQTGVSGEIVYKPFKQFAERPRVSEFREMTPEETPPFDLNNEENLLQMAQCRISVMTSMWDEHTLYRTAFSPVIDGKFRVMLWRRRGVWLVPKVYKPAIGAKFDLGRRSPFIDGSRAFG